MGEVLKVFISATTADLGAVRTAAKHALLTLGYFPIEQEHFGPAPETILEMLRRRIEESDAVLHIVGECYGAEPPLDPWQPRRSYAQWEYQYARELKKPLYVFVCGDAFPYTPHPEESPEACKLQRAHRAAVVAPGSLKYESIDDATAFEARIREINVKGIRPKRSRGCNVTIAVAFSLTLTTGYIAWSLRTGSPRPDGPGAAFNPAAFERVRIEESLRKQIERRALEEVAKLDPDRDREKIAGLAKARDQQLAEVGRFLEQMDQAWKKNEVSARYAYARQLLVRQGAPEALRHLAAGSAERDRELAAPALADEGARRKLLREKLLIASLLEMDAQWDQAETEYRAVVRAGGAWAEPRHRLAWFLYRRGLLGDPTAGSRQLSEAADLWRGALAAEPREADPTRWAGTQNNLALALRALADRSPGAEAERLRAEAERIDAELAQP